MASTRDHHHQKKNTITLSPFLFIAFLCSTSLFLAFSIFKTSTKQSLSPQTHHISELEKEKDGSKTKITRELCDYSDGKWVYSPTVGSVRYDNTCKEIFKGWNCISSNKPNALDLIKWHWKPKQCHLPPFDPARFLEHHRNTNIVQGLLGIL